MATRFMRIDLSDEARDFRPIALEPGLPLLDRSNTNAKILFRWLGGMVAEPVWQGDSVDFFVRDDHGGRLEEAVCQPAGGDDLQKLLADDVAKLKDRIEKAKPDTPTERALKKTVRRSFQELTGDPSRTDLDSFFFRYRDAAGRWRLVWCWGYQRVDQESAAAVVCTDPQCNLLFVRRPGQNPKCPSCEAAMADRPRKTGHWKRTALIGLLLFLLGAGLVWWYLHPERLVATPGTYTGPIGSRVQLKIERVGLLPFLGEDVTSRAVGVVLDPAVARFDQDAGSATLVGPGETLVYFHLGDVKPAQVALAAGPTVGPQKIVIEPGSVELAVGTTGRLKLIGQYADGTQADLTDAAEWTAQNDGIVYSYEGLLEGLTPGKTTVSASYRAGRKAQPLKAAADVRVDDVVLESLEVAIDPLPVGVGRASRLSIDAVSEAGKRYSVLESSLLSTEVLPDYLASVQRRYLKGRHAGSGKLAVTFDERLTAGLPFEVTFGPGLDGLVVKPEKLDMVVGQITDLEILSPSLAPIRVTSLDSAVVEVTGENRLIGRSEGDVEVEVSQGNQKQTVQVTVAQAEFESIAVDPTRVVVPVDDSVRPRVLARIAGQQPARDAEIAPDLLSCVKKPSAYYADFDSRTMELRGVTPTDPSSPQELAFRLGDHRAEAPVEVVVAPLRLALSPAGPVELPHGQQRRLAGWATYSGGRRVQVPPGRIDFQSASPSDAKPGLELRGEKVAALKAGAGPLNVYGTYFGRQSKPVVFRSVKADAAVRLGLDVDRKLRLVGETGRVTLTGTSPKGDVDLVPEMARFSSSAAETLKIDQHSGAFRASAPGVVTVTGSHEAANKAATLPLEVHDPANTALVFDPASLKLAVDEVAQLPLYLVVDDGGKKKTELLTGPGVGYSVSEPKAVRFRPPELVGLSPAGPFEIRASLYPILSRIATANVEVVPAEQPQGLRIVPSEPVLAAGQTVPLGVQQELTGNLAGPWKEVRPEAVAWTVPEELIWTPARVGLRPAVTVPQGAEGQFTVQAEFGGQKAVALVTTKQEGPDGTDPAAEVVLRREPPGVYLPVGSQQRYSIMVNKGDDEEPAAGIKWSDDFDNQYVRWQAPVLTAKRAGYDQWLRAEVDGRVVLFHTSTYQPGHFQQPPPRKDQPLAVMIIPHDLDAPVDGQSVSFPVGAEFDDFRVEAEYPDGFIRMVTRKATLRTSKPPQSGPVSASEGRLVGLRPGTDMVTAEFDGVRCKIPLGVEVTAALEVDQLRIAPAPITMLPGETVAMDVVGYKDGKSVGIITGMADLQWQSSNPQVARVDGRSVTGVAVGEGTVTARLGDVASPQVPVKVVGSIADALAVDPQVVRIHVGESARLGTDVLVWRGESPGKIELSDLCSVTPALPGVVRFDPQTRSLVGVSPGASAVAFAHGNKLTNAMVEVLPAAALGDDVEVVIEPAGGNLAPGQALDLRVLAVGSAGQRLDRTDSAALSSSDPKILALRGNRACALSPGTVTVTARIPESNKTGQAYLAVADQQIGRLIVEPPQLALSSGDVARLRILGQAPCGTRLLFAQPDLKLTPAGPNPQAIRIGGGSDVEAIRQGKAAVAVSWQDRLKRQVDVTVTDDVLTDLRIEPGRAVIHPGQPLLYQVTGLKGGRRRVLGPEDGVKLLVTQPEVARVAEQELAVLGSRPGRTAVMARLGDRQAEATLEVTPGSVAVGGDVLVDRPGDIYTYGPGAGYYGGHGGWRGWRGYGGWSGWRGYDRDVFIDGGYVVPPADIRELRFVPDVLRLSANSPPTGVRVVEVLADGSHGRDVTADPGLVVRASEPGKVVTVEKTLGGPLLRPAAPGQDTVGAKLGTLTASPMLVSVGPAGVVGTWPARLVVAPDPLVLWPGEQSSFGTVMLDPGGGLPLRAIDYRLVPRAGQTVVSAAGDKALRGESPGVARVVVSAVGGPYDGLSTTATVQVSGGDPLRIEPAAVGLQVGQETPTLSVWADGPGGVPYRVPAVLESMDEDVLAADPKRPGRFIARAFGGTQIRASYRGREALAEVTVAGKRFVLVDTTLNVGVEDFDVSIEVLADETEGPLKYRVYRAGQPPPQSWVPAEKVSAGWQARLRSPRMAQGPSSTLYRLMIEASDPAGKSVAKYPLSFQLIPHLKRTDGR